MHDSTREKPPVETVRYERARISVTRGPDAGRVLESAGTIIRVGTGEGSQLRLRDDTVSKAHCEIELTEHGYLVRDCDSTNGILSGGIRVFEIAAHGPLELQLGETVLTITPLQDSEERLRATVGKFGKLIGESAKMRELFAVLAKVAPTELSVIIQGETGTGKELVAESIHAASERADQPFVVFDCSAVTPSLIESELFGHRRGAFTGAVGNTVGLLRQAHLGTLFIDELGELPVELQQKLLRVLQSGEFRPLGAREVERVDVRLIAATHRNLSADIEAGRFRRDLYYRLEGVVVSVPALRERREDIPLLVRHFLAYESRAHASALPAHAFAMFRNHQWPGNVRELRNVVRRMCVLPDLPFHGTPEAAPTEDAGRTALERQFVRPLLEPWSRDPAAPDRRDWLPLMAARRELEEAFEIDYLEILKRAAGGNKARAGSFAGVSRQAIQKLVRKHELSWSDSETDTE